MLKLLKWSPIDSLLVENQYFMGGLSQTITIWVWYVIQQFTCPHYTKNQATVSSGNLNILKIKIYNMFRHYLISCQKQQQIINFKVLGQIL